MFNVDFQVVSVSRTPGHTKHFQTIFLTKNVRLCDSPGLVFPSIVARPLQVFTAIYDNYYVLLSVRSSVGKTWENIVSLFAVFCVIVDSTYTYMMQCE